MKRDAPIGQARVEEGKFSFEWLCSAIWNLIFGSDAFSAKEYKSPDERKERV